MRVSHLAASGPLASIDMGSNSFRIEIGQVRNGRYHRHLYRKQTVRLGAGLDAEDHLIEEVCERGLACLRQFGELLAGMPGGQVRAVATQTLREARNRAAFLQRAEAALGFPIEVISGREEARLIYAGVSFLQPSTKRRLVIDIGGRSTEMILGQGRQPHEAESFGIGSVSLSLRFFAEGQFSSEAFRAAEVAAGAELEEALGTFTRTRWSEALGSSGTAGAVSDVLLACKQTDGRLTPASLRWLIQACIDAGDASRLDLPGLKPDRKAVLPGGLAILYTLLTHFGIQALFPAKGALRQGVIIDLHERLLARQHGGHHDMRDDSVLALQQRFAVDGQQAGHVAEAALSLYRQLAPDADLEARNELRWAAMLHEMGMMISHHEHHRHSAYLLAHVDAAGFSQSQQRRLSALVLGQRGGLRKIEAALQQQPLALQLLCLRLAVIICHARGAEATVSLKASRTGRSVRLRLPARWEHTHPRTLHLLHEESLAWSRSGALDLALA